jgi:hypothetical protein
LPNRGRGTNPNQSYQVSNESWLQKQNGERIGSIAVLHK